MATVYIQQRKNKNKVTYQVLFKDPATLKLKYYMTFQRKKDAQNAANELRRLLDTGNIQEVEKKKARLNLLTFEEVSELLKKDWLQRFETKDLRQKTLDEYLYMLNTLNKLFGDKLLCEVSEDDILNYRTSTASSTSNVNSNRHLFIIKQVFKKGVAARATKVDFAESINYLSEKGQERTTFLLPSDLSRLIKASQDGRAKFYLPALIFLGAEHGASKQECLSLRWTDIDFNFEGQGLIKFFRTKNSRKRVEFLMPRTREALMNWREHLRKKRKKCGIQNVESLYVFTRINGEPIKRFDSAWRTARRKANMTELHFHDLRHTFCSNLILSGADLKDVKDMIGHKDLAMTDRYSHLTTNHKRRKQANLAEHYAQSE